MCSIITLVALVNSRFTQLPWATCLPRNCLVAVFQRCSVPLFNRSHDFQVQTNDLELINFIGVLSSIVSKICSTLLFWQDWRIAVKKIKTFGIWGIRKRNMQGKKQCLLEPLILRYPCVAMSVTSPKKAIARHTAKSTVRGAIFAYGKACECRAKSQALSNSNPSEPATSSSKTSGAYKQTKNKPNKQTMTTQFNTGIKSQFCDHRWSKTSKCMNTSNIYYVSTYGYKEIILGKLLQLKRELREFWEDSPY